MIAKAKPRRRAALPFAPLLAVAALACDGATGPSQDFLIRLPDDNIGSTFVVSFLASASSTDSIDFEWEPATGAQSYTIAFWQASDRPSMEVLDADYSVPAFSIEVASPRIVERPFNPANEADTRRIGVVALDVGLADFTPILADAGLPAGQELYFVWSVFAENGAERWRSIERHRMVLEWEAP